MCGMQYNIFIWQNFTKVFLTVFTLILYMGYAPLVLYIYQKMFKEESIVSGPRLYYFGKIKRFVWNGVASRGWGKLLDFDL